MTIRTSQTLKGKKWIARYKDNVSSWAEILDTANPYENWDTIRFLGHAQAIELSLALRALYANGDPMWTKAFARQSIGVFDRILAEDKCRSDNNIDQFPGNRARTYESKAIAIALLENRTDQALWRAAADDFIAWVERAYDDAAYAFMYQADVSAALCARLICGDAAEALDVLKRAPRWRKWHTPDVPVLKRLAEVLAEDKPIPPDLVEQLEAVFEEVRDPDSDWYGASFLRFEVGGVLFKYVRRLGQPIDWAAVGQAIGV
ncbi:MAG: hypothetical protein AAF288_12280 [Planctomycetota bacterium]